MNEWIPIIFLAGIAAALSGLSFVLFKRWRTKNYFYVSLSAAISSAGHIVIFAISAAGVINSALLPIHIMMSLIFFLGIISSIHFLILERKGMLLYIISAGSSLILGGLYILNVAMTTVFVILGSFALVLVFVKTTPQHPKKMYFLIAYISFALGYILQAFGIFELKGALFIGSMLITISYVSMLLLTYDRIAAMVEAVSYSAVTDSLTGLWGKHYFIRKLNELILQGRAYAVIFSDIDNFKRLNDELGHQVGDQILQQVAKTFKEVCSHHAIVGRYGGEEMVAVVINPKVDPGSLSEKFRVRVEELTQSAPVTVSVGYSIFQEDITAEEFIKQADEAMYKAKTRGKNRVVSYQVF